MAHNKISFGVLVAALVAVHMILADDDDETRRLRWPSSVGIEIHRLQNLANEGLSHEERQERSLPSLPFLPALGSCDYTAEPGLSCSDCSTAKLCLPNNVSLTTNCGALLPNCNGGLCTSSPSSACSDNSS